MSLDADSGPTVRILVIDDEPALREIIKQALTVGGFEARTAENGNEGIKLMRTTRFDLVITDLLMPEKEGIETIREIHSLAPGMKIIAMSGGMGIGANFLEISRKLGASATLKKPFDCATLLETVRGLLSPR